MTSGRLSVSVIFKPGAPAAPVRLKTTGISLLEGTLSLKVMPGQPDRARLLPYGEAAFWCFQQRESRCGTHMS